MLLMQQQELSGGVLPEPNTFIGGVGASYITTAADYAAFFSDLSESDIENFVNDGTNISFYVGKNYNQDTGLFGRDRTDFTYFIDADEMLLSFAIWAFYQTTNLEYLYASQVASPGGSRFIYNMANLKKINISGVTGNLDGRWKLSFLTALKKLDLRNATSISEANPAYVYFGRNLTSLERLHIGSVTTIGTTNLRLAQALEGNLKGLNNGCKIYHNSALGVTNRNAFNKITFNGTQIGDTFDIDTRTYTCVAGSPSTDGEFQYDASDNQTSLNFYNAVLSDGRSGASDFTAYNNGAVYTVVYANSVGTSSEVSTTEGGGNVGSTVWENATLIGGNDVHPMLMYARDYRSAILTQISTPITVNPPTGLSASSITSSGFTINFTPPTANANGTDGYEVWVEEKNNPANPINYFEYQEISATGTAITGLESGKTYIVKMNTIDGQMNFSDFSSTIEVTTL